MEQKKTDFNSLIGMLLVGAILLFWMYTNKEEPTTEDNTTKTEQVVNNTSENTNSSAFDEANPILDSLQNAKYSKQLGSFAYSAINGTEGTTTIENNLVKLVISNKGGQIVEAEVKNYKTHDSLPLYLIKDNNANFNINFGTTENRILNTENLYFQPTVTKNGNNDLVSMKLKVSDTQFLEYRYEMQEDSYMVNFAVRSQNLQSIINSATPIQLDWFLKGYSNEQSLRTENTMYTNYYYKSDDEVDYIKAGDTEVLNDVNWVAYKQHFFTSNLLTDQPFNNATITSLDLVKNEEIDTVFTKQFQLKTPLALTNGELNYNMKWFYGPSDYNLLKTYEGTDLEETADLGWGIFGFLNRTIFYPVFNLLSGLLSNYGLIIILMTIVVRILMSPLVYKSYVSSAKMKVIRPELTALNEKYPGKENAMKRQQETMAIQRKAGVSMLSGCIPALLQMPIFFALFKFFPTNIALRQESFLWANDLSSYDIIFNLPKGWNIPFYGNHVSLFPILASIAIFFYMRMNQSQQSAMQAPTQEGMPDMSKIMKYMIYFSPIMMLFFFNNYASGLSLYYFISNLLTIAIMLVIKNFVIDEDKIHRQIEENKKRPEKKKSKFRQRIDDAMKQAQAQQQRK
jgi:YidC/Oxa1 family membrane protein insertase